MTDALLALPGVSLDLIHCRVLRNGQPVKVEPRAWRVLEQLARFRHRVVTKEELLAALRPEGEVSDAALRQAVRAARRAIGDDGAPPIIRSIARVGYIFDVPQGPGGAPAAAHPVADMAPAVFVAPWRNETGLPRLQWIEAGLPAVLAHALALDTRTPVRQAASLDLRATPDRAFLRKMMRGFGARYGVSGTVRRLSDGFELTLQIHTREDDTTIVLRGVSVAELAVPALQAVQRQVLGPHGSGATEAGLASCSPLALELFARSRQATAEHRHAAALRALELLNDLVPGFPRLELELLRAQAICGDERADAFADTLLLNAQRDADAALEAQVRQSLGSLHAARGQLREAALSFRQSLAIGRGVMSADWQAHTLGLLASMECRLGEMHTVPAHLDQAQGIFLRIGNHYGLMQVLWVRAVMSSLSGNAAQAIAWNRRLAASARRFGAGTTLVAACINLALDLLYADRLDEALTYAEESSATAQAIESSAELVSMIANVHCLIHRLLGRPDAAQALLAQLPHPADTDDEGYLWMAHGHAAMAQGRADEAADCFQRAALECRRRSNRIAEVPLLPWLVDALVRSGRLQIAQAELDRADAQPHLQDESTTANLLYSRALVARRRMQEPEAQVLLARLASAPAALPLFRRLGQELTTTSVDEQGVPPTPVSPPNGVMRRQYRFANCVLDVERRELWVDGRRQALAPKSFDVLVHLYRNRHRVVAQNELLDAVWGEAAGSLEVVAQAITKIRQVLRKSRTQAVLLQTLYGKGYRLLADARVETDDDTAATLLSTLQPAPERPLAVVPWTDKSSAPSVVEGDLAYPMEVVGYALALHARLQRMPVAELQAALAGAPGASPQQAVAAIHARSPDAHVLFARLRRRDETLELEYMLVSPVARTEGIVRERSPTLLGRRLAAKLLHLHADDAQALAQAADDDAWVIQMIDFASRAAEDRRWSSALRILDVVLDHAPDSSLAAELKARVETGIATYDRMPQACNSK
jgi:DNA-binding winged helix-turn-helix (wHTH) protein